MAGADVRQHTSAGGSWHNSADEALIKSLFEIEAVRSDRSLGSLLGEGSQVAACRVNFRKAPPLARYRWKAIPQAAAGALRGVSRRGQDNVNFQWRVQGRGGPQQSVRLSQRLGAAGPASTWLAGRRRYVDFPAFMRALRQIACFEFPDQAPEAAMDSLLAHARQLRAQHAKTPKRGSQPRQSRSHPFQARHEDAVAALLHRMHLVEWREALRGLGVLHAVDLGGVGLADLLRCGMDKKQATRLLDAVGALDRAGALVAADAHEARAQAATQHRSVAVGGSASTGSSATSEAGEEFTWEECMRDDGFVYYHNHRTGESSWDDPPAGEPVLTLARKQRQSRSAAQASTGGELYQQHWPRGEERGGWRDTWQSVVPAEQTDDASEAGAGALFTPVQRRAEVRRQRGSYADSVASGAPSLPAEEVGAHLARKAEQSLVAASTAPGPARSVRRGDMLRFTDEELDEAFQDAPPMTRETKLAIAKSHVFSSTRVRGYADPRPDLRPVELQHMRAPAEHAAEVNQLKGRDRAFAGSLRKSHHRSQRSLGGLAGSKRPWNGGSKPPSDAVPSYAYRHAAATEQGNVFDRLTDSRGFTGSHRHRFDAKGRGLGLKGRGDDVSDYGKVVLNTPAPGEGAPWLIDPPRGRLSTPRGQKK